VAGPDNTFGNGRIDALASVRRTIPSASGVTSFAVSGNTTTGANVTAAQLGFTDPDDCPLSLSFTGGCGSGSGASIDCPFGANKVTVSATKNNVTKSSSADLVITVSSFVLNAAPASSGSNSVRAGQSATYSVTVTPKFGAFANSITLACTDLPALSSCAFTPGTVTPGPNPVISSLTITTTGSASASGLWSGRFTPHLHRLANGRPHWLLACTLFLLMMAFWLAAPHRRRSAALLPTALVLVLALLATQTACGGSGNNGTSSNSGTPGGSYAISISGTSGSLVQTATATLRVQ
jgi:hypothetical protein